jgi:hypothetical protein
MGCEWTFRFSQENDLIMDDELHDGLLPRRGSGWKEFEIISIRHRPFARKNGPSRGYKT